MVKKNVYIGWVGDDGSNENVYTGAQNVLYFLIFFPQYIVPTVMQCS